MALEPRLVGSGLRVALGPSLRVGFGGLGPRLVGSGLRVALGPRLGLVLGLGPRLVGSGLRVALGPSLRVGFGSGTKISWFGSEGCSGTKSEGWFWGSGTKISWFGSEGCSGTKTGVGFGSGTKTGVSFGSGTKTGVSFGSGTKTGVGFGSGTKTGVSFGSGTKTGNSFGGLGPRLPSSPNSVNTARMKGGSMRTKVSSGLLVSYFEFLASHSFAPRSCVHPVTWRLGVKLPLYQLLIA